MNVFVYGTLMSPEVVTTLLKRFPRSQAAHVHGYRRYAIKGYKFPAMIPADSASEVQGLVLFDLTPLEVEIFDEFEGDEYYKASVRPKLDEAGSSVDTSVYLWQDRSRHMLYGEWNYEAWRRDHMADYLVMCAEFREEVMRMLKPSSRPYQPVEPVEDIHAQA